MKPQLILLDVMMPDVDGLETCRRLKANAETAGIPVIFVSARDETPTLVEGFRSGAVDFIAKPFQVEEVRIRVETHLKISRLNRELAGKNVELQLQTEQLVSANQKLTQETSRRREVEQELHTADEKLSLLSSLESQRWGIDAFVGRSESIASILDSVRRLQNFAGVNALITGESGTGKELIARAIHFGSARSKQPFIPLNCVAIPADLAESMFFGHVRGSFTGATMDRKGYFELAHGGTLFLDEIGDMPLPLQAKLLRVLEDGMVLPIGGSSPRRVEVRIVAATNADLRQQVSRGTFRQDLYFRLAQFTMELPPLRTRPEDISLLATHFLDLFAREMGLKSPRMTAEAISMLMRHDFPGNVRELKNIIERALIESGGGEIGPEHLHVTRFDDVAIEPVESTVQSGIVREKGDGEIPLNLERAEHFLIQRALAESGGNVAEAARKLGINRTRIYRRMNAGTGSAT